MQRRWPCGTAAWNPRICSSPPATFIRNNNLGSKSWNLNAEQGFSIMRWRCEILLDNRPSPEDATSHRFLHWDAECSADRAGLRGRARGSCGARGSSGSSGADERPDGSGGRHRFGCVTVAVGRGFKMGFRIRRAEFANRVAFYLFPFGFLFFLFFIFFSKNQPVFNFKTKYD